jgi:hypothetical protein
MTVIPGKPPIPPEVFSTPARAAKVAKLADTMHGHMTADQASRLAPAEWQQITDAIGLPKPSATTIADTIAELKKREAAAVPSPALQEALKRPGALEAAQALQKHLAEAGESGTPDPALEATLQQSIDAAKAAKSRRAGKAKNLPAPAEHPGKAAFEAARTTR